MDPIAAAHFIQQREQLEGEVATRLLKKTLDIGRQEADNLTRLLDSGNGLGVHLDLRA